ncbi:dihydrodipicolinate synthase family protein [Citrobacter amalonaticus]|uniref:Dihydrodipicolinate synthase family protein n=1 Tax=Citrobacter amalonaticus TaxID=35703 RepID=A0A2S4RT71_CITAM|nr:dihydrodipicolinate synthase family protein [Citrobacter amalonaticus]POT56903.1 dihydrodipicolinate synthase family protein [Citrobacter amalonaticus]POT71853.1 dihydrodipicolinate synthase family protein [Citrobacter amalonaticus]POU62993.1 dihydrodipicolinate synthase family protein [Citrobacter amalonaticus]POV04793.1 dihydrodipicolinate synthase family protein [Citrobacter amalonaticus]
MSEKNGPFHGAWCPSITPFNEQGNIDLPALQQHFQRLEEAGTDVILLMGSIGEFTSLTLDERLQLIREARKMSPLPMVVNISTTCMTDMLRLAEEAWDCEYQAVMILPHYYFQQTPIQLLSYYRELGQRLRGKWFAYNFPARTGCDLDAALVAQLAEEFPNFAGVKDTVDCLSHTRAIIQAVKPVRCDFAVLSGYDEYLIPNLLAGGAGVISGLNNICPELFVQAIKSWEGNDVVQLNHIQREISRLSSIYTIGNDFVTTIKTTVARKFQYAGEKSRSFAGELTEHECRSIDILFDIKDAY